jgi:hypothetical protein
MKSHLTYFLLFFILLFSQNLVAQCPNDNTYFDTYSLPNVGNVATNPAVYAGEYILVNVQQGGFYTFYTCGANFDTKLTLYSDAGGSSLASNDNACGTASRISWTATFSGNLRVLLDKNNCGHDTIFAPLSVSFDSLPQPPSNDDCATAQFLSPNIDCIDVAATTKNATPSAFANCRGNADDDVWFRFVANTQNMTIDVYGEAGFEPTIEVFRGSGCGGLTSIFCDGSNSRDLRRDVSGLTIGQTYYIRVYDYDVNEHYDFNICVIGAPSPINDDCQNAILLQPFDTCNDYSATTRGGTLSFTGCTGNADDDVWFQFVANNPSMSIDIYQGTAFRPVVEVFQGNSCNNWTRVYCQSGTNGSFVANLTGLIIGQRYYFRIYDSRAGASTAYNFNVCLIGTPPPSNDNCTQAINLTHYLDSLAIGTLGSIWGATASAPSEGGFCSGIGDDDVWYSFVAQATVAEIFLTTQGNFDGVFQLYFNGCQSHLACVNDVQGAGTERRKFEFLTVGATYHIRLYSFGNTRPNNRYFTIAVGYPQPENDLCTRAVRLTETIDTSIWHSSSVRGATRSFTSAPHCTGETDDDVWFSFVATSTSADIRLRTQGNFDGVYQVFFNNSCRRNHLACVNDVRGAGIESRRLDYLTIGEIYNIRVYSFAAARPTMPEFSIQVLGLPALAISQSAINAGFSVQPNPSEGIFRLSIHSELLQPLAYEIVDMLGQTVVKSTLGTTETDINLQHLPPSAYLLVIYAADGSKAVRKLVKL